jgi:osmoprotectant transport system ATP-binding protein
VVGIDRLMRVIGEMRETERGRDRPVAEAPPPPDGASVGALPTQRRGTSRTDGREPR